MTDVLKITTIEKRSGLIAMRLEGQLDVKGAEQLKTHCLELIEENYRYGIFNLEGVTVISSSGIGALLVVQEDFADVSGKALYVSLSREVRSVIRMMDLEQVLNLTDSLEEALACAEA